MFIIGELHLRQITTNEPFTFSLTGPGVIAEIFADHSSIIRHTGRVTFHFFRPARKR
jgi:hypothetical protein